MIELNSDSERQLTTAAAPRSSEQCSPDHADTNHAARESLFTMNKPRVAILTAEQRREVQ
jgi:hypothetical protein